MSDAGALPLTACECWKLPESIRPEADPPEKTPDKRERRLAGGDGWSWLAPYP